MTVTLLVLLVIGLSILGAWLMSKVIKLEGQLKQIRPSESYYKDKARRIAEQFETERLLNNKLNLAITKAELQGVASSDWRELYARIDGVKH
jgi:hypothetical protein